jgi:uncharacterized membrane protein
MRGLNELPSPDAGRSVTGRNRLDSIDLLRGVVMVVMALDHVRDYFSNAMSVDPVDLKHTTAALFLTRWVTHFCAPTFVFLAGTGAFLYGTRCRTGRQLSWFLLTRGLWLVLLETTLVRLGWSFNFDYAGEFGGGVIWAIGWSMVLLAGLVFLPTAAVAVIGVGLIAFHNLLDGLSPEAVGLPRGLWVIFHNPGAFEIFPGFRVGTVDVPGLHFGTGYCLLPWLGVMAAGYGFGALYLLEPRARRPQLLGLGLALTALFVVLRYGNAYGDSMSNGPGQPAPERGTFPGPWAAQDNPWFTLFSFLSCQKYPPSLCYLLMTLGLAITVLGCFDGGVGRLGRFFVTFGRVPLFYYLLHIPLIHGLMVAGDYYRYGWSPFAARAPWTLDRVGLPSDYGYPLPVVYLVWLGVVLTLYPVCRWYAGVKERHRDGWLSYL